MNLLYPWTIIPRQSNDMEMQMDLGIVHAHALYITGLKY